MLLRPRATGFFFGYFTARRPRARARPTILLGLFCSVSASRPRATGNFWGVFFMVSVSRPRATRKNGRAMPQRSRARATLSLTAMTQRSEMADRVGYAMVQCHSAQRDPRAPGGWPMCNATALEQNQHRRCVTQHSAIKPDATRLAGVLVAEGSGATRRTEERVQMKFQRREETLRKKYRAFDSGINFGP